MQKPKIALIMAGGKGERMNAAVPKQFIEIQGKPILMHTLEVFHSFDQKVQLVLVLPVMQIEFWEKLCRKHAFTLPHTIVAGGHTRFHSVKNGLEVVAVPSLVAVHDAVRPFVSIDTISRCFDVADKENTAIPVISLVDSVREVLGAENRAVNRDDYKLVQTPQIFDGELLKKAYEQDFSSLFTDDASVVEALGEKIHLVEGNRENIKITTEFDLKVAEALF